MLTVKRLESGLLEVRQDIHGFYGTKTDYWYYDTENWRQSSHGKKDDPVDRKMSEDAITWVKKYYLPKLEEQS